MDEFGSADMSRMRPSMFGWTICRTEPRIASARSSMAVRGWYLEVSGEECAC